VDLLEGLDEVDWASLYGTYGYAEDVSRHIRALRSSDPGRRGGALAGLSDAVVHQGTRWQVSAHVVPFLVRLVDDPGTPDRRGLVTLLRRIGFGDDRVPEVVGEAAVTAEQERGVIDRLCDEGEFDEEWGDLADACAVKWRADAFRAVALHVDAYRRWLGDDDPEVASQAAELLAWFDPAEPTVAALLYADRGAGVRASANLALAHAEVAHSMIGERMTALLDHPDTAVRVTAAIALAHRLGPELPDPALDILVEAKECEALPDFPAGWRMRAPRGYVALALQRLGLS
jgi:hypothetical protein